MSTHKPPLLIAGAVLASMGLVRGGIIRSVFLGLGLTAVGVSLACGFIPGDEKLRKSRIRGIRRGASFQHDNEAPPASQKPEDDIDEAVMESFPASDPPAGMSSGSVDPNV